MEHLPHVSKDQSILLTVREFIDPVIIMHNYLNESSCDILCLQETWHLDENTHL